MFECGLGCRTGNGPAIMHDVWRGLARLPIAGRS
jgi:hypothetical protein